LSSFILEKKRDFSFSTKYTLTLEGRRLMGGVAWDGYLPSLSKALALYNIRERPYEGDLSPGLLINFI
jgi:hypothetical protein